MPQMKRYVVFAGMSSEETNFRGWMSFFGDFDSIDDAKIVPDNMTWAQIVDMEAGGIILRRGAFGLWREASDGRRRREG